MTVLLRLLADLLVMLVLPWLLVGVVNRTKARWSGRVGPPLWQSAWDVLRLARKRSVYSRTTTPIFRITPYVGLLSTLAAGAVVPVLGVAPFVSFNFDFVWFAWLWGFGRLATMLGALDTGSPFEGMGASREATFATLAEPALLLSLGALGTMTAGGVHGDHSLAGTLGLHVGSVPALACWAASLLALLIVVQAECARMPVDDPTTHLELTMIHEAMVLDHSGPELAAIQAGVALKLMLGMSLIATLLNPWSGTGDELAAGVTNVVLLVIVAIGTGTVESLVARLRMRVVPRYLLTAVVAGLAAVYATTWARP